MSDDETRIIPPSDQGNPEPPPSPLDRGRPESGASASRPAPSADPVPAEPQTERRHATPGIAPAEPASGAAPIPDTPPAPLKPLHRGKSGDAAMPAPPPLPPPPGDYTSYQQPPSPDTVDSPPSQENQLPRDPEQTSSFEYQPSSEEKVAEEPPVVPSSHRQPAYHKSPYEKSVDRDKKTRQLLWALAASGFVLAVLALLLSLGVLQVRSSQVTSSDIATGAVGSKEIAPGSVASSNLNSQLQKDILGKEGPPGPKGARGPAGQTGKRGSPGITALQLVDREVIGTSNDAEVSAVALCADDQVAVSGGATIFGGGGTVALTASEPSIDLGGWRGAAVQNETGSGSWRLKVYAVCAQPSQSLLDSIG